MRNVLKFASLFALVYLVIVGVAACSAETRLRPGVGLGATQTTPQGTTTTRAGLDLGEYEVGGKAAHPVTGVAPGDPCPGGVCGIPHGDALPTLTIKSDPPVVPIAIGCAILAALVGIGVVLLRNKSAPAASKGVARWPVLVTVAGLSLVALSFVACDKDQATVSIEGAGHVAQDAGAATGLPWLSLIGTGLLAVPSILGWKRGTAAQSFTHSAWSPDQFSEFVADLRKPENQPYAVALKRVLDEAK